MALLAINPDQMKTITPTGERISSARWADRSYIAFNGSGIWYFQIIAAIFSRFVPSIVLSIV
jgi:hypothetical protein